MWSLHLVFFSLFVGLDMSILVRGSCKCHITGANSIWDSIVEWALSLELPGVSGNDRGKGEGKFRME